MPMFKGKAKLKTSEPDTVNTKQNYDYSGMRMATATSKSNRPNDGEEDQQFRDGGDRRQQNRNQQQQQAQNDDSDDDFEVVKEKKRIIKRRDSDEEGFGGGKPPTFSRGSRGGFQRRD